MKITKWERPAHIEVWLREPKGHSYGEGGVLLFEQTTYAFHYTDTGASIGGWINDGEQRLDTQWVSVAAAEGIERRLRREGWVDITETVMNEEGMTFSVSLPVDQD